ncbi:MAG: hypothetical protein OSA48_10770 [Akkermansiaceae bacterium]|jgi:hypothetical protein|nr:hypothetical protein [Akkermansiaceae bacterium]|tara:strand:- start:374 stop:598 length:225 start_codon:yes stop_codon:yes gene_type:complete
MNLRAFLTLCVLLAIPASARTFTNTAGKTIEAETLTASAKTITLKFGEMTDDKFIKILTEGARMSGGGDVIRVE